MIININDTTKFSDIIKFLNEFTEILNEYLKKIDKIKETIGYDPTGEITEAFEKAVKPIKEEIKDIQDNIDNVISNIDKSLTTYGEADEKLKVEIERLFEDVEEVNELLEETFKDIDSSTTYTDFKYISSENDGYYGLRCRNVTRRVTDALGYERYSDEANTIIQDMNTFLHEDRGNIDQLEFFLTKIPDNYAEYDKSCNWDSVPNYILRYWNATYRCQWITVNDTTFRFTGIVNTDCDYPTLKTVMNEVYCYNLMNDIKTWNPDYLEILSKREYIDVIVLDYATNAGAAYYQPNTPYSDHILLPTVMGEESIYSSADTYDYLHNTLFHEMGHYFDGICGTDELDENGNHNSAYDLVYELMNSHVIDIELINHNGALSAHDLEYFSNYHIGSVNPVSGEEDSFREGMAEFMRADLVDHDAFVKLIGQENYDKLFGYFKEMESSKSKYYGARIDSDASNDVTIYQVDEKNVICNERKYGGNNEGFFTETRIKYENGQMTEKKESHYDETGLIYSATRNQDNVLLSETKVEWDGDIKRSLTYYGNILQTSCETQYKNGIEVGLTYRNYNKFGQESYLQSYNQAHKLSYEKYTYYNQAHELSCEKYIYHNEDGSYTIRNIYYENDIEIRSNEEKYGSDGTLIEET